MEPYKGRKVVSTPIRAEKERTASASTDQASQDSHHVHGKS